MKVTLTIDGGEVFGEIVVERSYLGRTPAAAKHAHRIVTDLLDRAVKQAIAAIDADPLMAAQARRVGTDATPQDAS